LPSFLPEKNTFPEKNTLLGKKRKDRYSEGFESRSNLQGKI
jgi:hypothetical protein